VRDTSMQRNQSHAKETVPCKGESVPCKGDSSVQRRQFHAEAQSGVGQGKKGNRTDKYLNWEKSEEDRYMKYHSCIFTHIIMSVPAYTQPVSTLTPLKDGTGQLEKITADLLIFIVCLRTSF